MLWYMAVWLSTYLTSPLYASTIINCHLYFAKKKKKNTVNSHGRPARPPQFGRVRPCRRSEITSGGLGSRPSSPSLIYYALASRCIGSSLHSHPTQRSVQRTPRPTTSVARGPGPARQPHRRTSSNVWTAGPRRRGESARPTESVSLRNNKSPHGSTRPGSCRSAHPTPIISLIRLLH